MRIFHAVTHTSSSGEVDDGIERTVLLEELAKFRLILEIEFREDETISMPAFFQLLQAPLFETNVVIVIQVVDADYLMALLKEQLGGAGGNEAGDTGN